MFSQLLAACGSAKIPELGFYSPHWTNSWKNPSNHFWRFTLLKCYAQVLQLWKGKKHCSLFILFATSDFKGLCGILLPPFIFSPIQSAPGYSAVPQMEVISELWSSLSPFSDLCKLYCIALSCRRTMGWWGSVLFLMTGNSLWDLIAELMFS